MLCVLFIGEPNAINTMESNDHFASGILYGVVKCSSLEECCKVGACSSGFVAHSLGGEVTSENWQWMSK